MEGAASGKKTDRFDLTQFVEGICPPVWVERAEEEANTLTVDVEGTSNKSMALCHSSMVL